MQCREHVHYNCYFKLKYYFLFNVYCISSIILKVEQTSMTKKENKISHQSYILPALSPGQSYYPPPPCIIIHIFSLATPNYLVVALLVYSLISILKQKRYMWVGPHNISACMVNIARNLKNSKIISWHINIVI